MVNKQTVYDMIAHIIHEPVVGIHNYWYIKSVSVNSRDKIISVSFVNGLVYVFPIPIFYLSKDIMCKYRHKRTTSKQHAYEWSVRTVHPQTEFEHNTFRLYNHRENGYWIFDPDVILTIAEAAYEDFCHQKYLSFPPEPAIQFISNNIDAIKIRISPRSIKNTCFFNVARVYLYKKKRALHFFTKGGDRYGIALNDDRGNNRILNLLISQNFSRFNRYDSSHLNTLGGGAWFISSEMIDNYVRQELNTFVMKLAFQVDYRFKGHYSDYLSNNSWCIYPGRQIENTNFVWPAQYKW